MCKLTSSFRAWARGLQASRTFPSRGASGALVALLAGLLLVGLVPAPADAKGPRHRPAGHAHGLELSDTARPPLVDDPAPPRRPVGTTLSEPAVAAAVSAPYPYTQTFLLESKPGSLRTIYLDFDGGTITGTAWNQAQFGTPESFVAPPFSLDASSAFSTAEQDLVQSIWQRVAEDFAPFDVNVTTRDLGAAAITRTSTTDQQYGTVAMIAPSADVSRACGGCGGYAYIGTFDRPGDHAYYQPAWVMPQNLSYNAKYVAEAASHEVGHNLGLDHDASSSEPSYYRGHGAWAPIMGAGYDRPVSQWSKGEHTGAVVHSSQVDPDDLAVMGANGALVRTDDHGDTDLAATPLAGTGPFAATGVVSTDADVDVFKLSVPAGTVRLTASPAPTGPNLDIRLGLRSATSALAAADPLVARVSNDVATGLDATLSAVVPAGDYYVHVEGVGTGDPNTGYSGYGSLGQYSLRGTFEASTVTTAPAPPTGVSASVSGTTASVSFTPGATGGSPITSFYALCTSSSGGTSRAATGAASPLSVASLSVGKAYTCQVRATNAVGTSAYSAPSPSFVVTTVPGAPTNVTVVRSGTTAAVSFTPGPPGASPVKRFEAQCVSSNRGRTRSVTGAGSPLSVSRLTAGRTYRCRVRATNAYGTGPYSAYSSPFST